jgi:S1-C subfamily serine protease
MTEVRALQRLVGGTPAGKRVNLIVLREGKRQTLPVPIGAMPPEMVAERVAGEYGFVLRGPGGGGPEQPRGDDPVVVAVADRSPAKQGGLQAGDRIVRLNGEEVTSLSAVADLLRRQPLTQPLEVEVLREGRRLSLHLPAPLAGNRGS